MDDPVPECPSVGMKFKTEHELREYYKVYGKNMGFGICKLGARNEDGKQKYFSIACSKSGKNVSKAKNIMHPRPSTKTNCKAKINVTVRSEDVFQITSVCLDHNHSLSPSKSRHLKSHRTIDATAKRRLELNDEAGINLTKTFQSFVVEAGGYDSLTFDERSCRNHIYKARSLRLGNGDAEALCQYFDRMRSRSATFDFSYDLDSELRIRNVFWADGRCRAAFEYFSDVVSFDTTYLTNRYDMPFAPFVGVNHHGQSILLGCGLLSSEDSESFVWLFKTWLTCMHGRPPKAIITDQCRAMAIAIETIFPNTRHRYCLWHIMKKIPTKLAANNEYKAIKRTLKNIIYNSITIEQCELDWLKMITEFKLEQNDWLNSLYRERSKWIPVYVKDHFWAGMSTSQRSESINAFFDGYVHSKTSLKQFVEQYHRALKKNIENENKLDFQSSDSIIPIVSGFALERQFQSLYTNNIFKLLQNELRALMYCDIPLYENNETTSIFVVVETKLADDGKHTNNNMKYKVHYTPTGCYVNCQCKLFEFRGILCRHILVVLRRVQVNEVPEYYVLDRWRKDIKRGYQSINNVYDVQHCQLQRNRYNSLTPMVHAVHELASQSDKFCLFFAAVLRDIEQKMITDSTEKTCTPSLSTPTATTDEIQTTTIENTPTSGNPSTRVVHSPVRVRARGRPPTKRKQSTVEKLIQRSATKSRKPKTVTASLESGQATSVSQQHLNDPATSQLSFTDLLSSCLPHGSISNDFIDDPYTYYLQRR